MKIIITVDSIEDLIQLAQLLQSIFNAKEGEIINNQVNILKNINVQLKQAVKDEQGEVKNG